MLVDTTGPNTPTSSWTNY